MRFDKKTNKKFNKKEYDKNNRILICIQLSKKNDVDIINAIDFKNKQGSIKKLIRKAISGNYT